MSLSCFKAHHKPSSFYCGVCTFELHFETKPILVQGVEAIRQSSGVSQRTLELIAAFACFSYPCLRGVLLNSSVIVSTACAIKPDSTMIDTRDQPGLHYHIHYLCYWKPELSTSYAAKQSLMTRAHVCFLLLLTLVFFVFFFFNYSLDDMTQPEHKAGFDQGKLRRPSINL